MIVLVTCLAYAGSLDGAFVADDLPSVRDNPLLESLSWPNIQLIFSSFDDANYMPLKVLSLAIDRAVWGPAPFGFHLGNLLLHAGCALMIFSILLRLGFSRIAAFGVALLWAVHPLQVESVAWISERKNVLSGLFFFAAFRVYIEFSERRRFVMYAGALALFVLALLSKMSTLVLPAVCLAYEATYKMRCRRIDLVAAAPMFVLGAIAVWYNLAGSPIHGGVLFHGGSPTVTWLSSTVVVFRYLWHTVWPVGLAPGYDVPLRGSPFDPTVFFSLLGLIGIGVIVVLLIRRKRREAFWILWSAITLAPMLNIVPFPTMMQDRYMYLALLGPLALFGCAFDSITAPMAKRFVATATLVATTASVFVTIQQVEVWSNAFTLWARTATTIPMPAVRRSIGSRQEDKMSYLEAALVDDPDNPTLHNNLGNLNYHVGLTQEALRHYEEANRLRPDEPNNQMNLGRVYVELSRWEDAERALARATELRPHNYSAWLYLLRLHLRLRDATAARRAFDNCVRARPDLASSPMLNKERAGLQGLER